MYSLRSKCVNMVNLRAQCWPLAVLAYDLPNGTKSVIWHKEGRLQGEVALAMAVRHQRAAYKKRPVCTAMAALALPNNGVRHSRSNDWRVEQHLLFWWLDTFVV